MSENALPFEFDAEETARVLSDLLNAIALRAKAKERFSVKIIRPCETEIKDCFLRNCTLMGTLKLSIRDHARGPIEIPIFYPYHGVFVMGQGNGTFNRPERARLMAWRPCLVRRPGLWLLQSWKKGQPERYIEVGLPEGKAVRVNSKKGKPGYATYRMILPRRQIEEKLATLDDTGRGARGPVNKLRSFFKDPAHIMVTAQDLGELEREFQVILNLGKQPEFAG